MIAKPVVLGQAQLQTIFTQQIQPQHFSGLVTQTHPLVVFIAGQPGAGKNSAQAQVEKTLGLRKAAVIDADNFRGYHPDWDRLRKSDDRTAADHTHGAASRWVDLAIGHVSTSRSDAVVSATLKNPSSAQARIAPFLQWGYSVALVMVSVHELISRLGIVSRYHGERKALGWGRYVGSDVHDEAYEQLRRTAEAIDSGAAANYGITKVYVHTRRGGLGLDLLNSTKRNPPTVVSRLDLGRAIPAPAVSAIQSGSLRTLTEELCRLQNITAMDQRVVSQLF